MKKTGLGRGLDTLLPESDELFAKVVQEIPVDEIDPNTAQPRRNFEPDAMTQLCQSIRESGVLQPILVAESGARFRIIAGERRWRAARMAGLTTVPCIVRDMDRIAQMEVALIENIQREDLNPMEEAEAVKSLMQQCGYTQEAAAQKLGKSRPALANLLRLLTLPEEISDLVRKGVISQGHARVLAGVNSREKQLELCHQCVLHNLNVRQLEQMATKDVRVQAEKPLPKPLSPELSELEGRIRETLGVRTTFTGNRKKGKIVLNYYSTDELERLYEALEKLCLG